MSLDSTRIFSLVCAPLSNHILKLASSPSGVQNGLYQVSRGTVSSGGDVWCLGCCHFYLGGLVLEGRSETTVICDSWSCRWYVSGLICFKILNGQIYLGFSFLHSLFKLRFLVDSHTRWPDCKWGCGCQWRSACMHWCCRALCKCCWVLSKTPLLLLN